jgi:hypothetical protein
VADEGEKSADWAFGRGGFAKLYGDRLAHSSLLDRDVATRWVFIFMLSQADGEGRFRCASVAGLARAAAVTLEQAERATAELEAPDPDSTTKLDDGRRIRRVPGGWQIVAYATYRDYRTPRQLAEAARKRRQREAAKARREKRKAANRDMSRDVPRLSLGHCSRRKKEDVREQTTEKRKERKDGGHGSKEGTPASTAASLPPSVSHDDYRQERERLAEEITALATAIATEACVDLAMVVRLASRMDAKNGHPENEGFADPRTCPSLAWLQTTLAKLPQVRAQLTRPVPL